MQDFTKELQLDTTSIEAIKATLDELTSKRDRLDEQISAFQAVLLYYEEHPFGQEAVELTGASLRDEMEHILQLENEPMHFKQIHRRLQDRGISVPGNDPARNVGAHLSGDQRFEPLGRGMWGLSAWTKKNSPGRQHHPAPIDAEPDDIVTHVHSSDDEDLDEVPF